MRRPTPARAGIPNSNPPGNKTITFLIIIFNEIFQEINNSKKRKHHWVTPMVFLPTKFKARLQRSAVQSELSSNRRTARSSTALLDPRKRFPL